MQDALEFGKQHVQVSDDDMNVIMHARKSLLFAQGQAWSKKDRGDMFDVTMGAYDGAEACEVVGAYILHKLAVHLDWTSVGALPWRWTCSAEGCKWTRSGQSEKTNNRSIQVVRPEDNDRKQPAHGQLPGYNHVPGIRYVQAIP